MMKARRLRPSVLVYLPRTNNPRIARYSIARTLKPLDLAYDLYEPPQNKKEAQKPFNAPTIFLHGLFGSKKNNRSMSKVFARDLHRPVYALDLRNHGASPHDPYHQYDALANDVIHFLDTHKLENPTLIGHSMGAKAAMCVALAEPTRIANLVVVDNAPIDAALKSDFGTYVRGMREVEKADVKKLSEADSILEPYAQELPVRQFLMTNLIRSEEDKSKFVWRVPLNYLIPNLDAMGDFPFRNPDEARYQRPTLFVRGTRSNYVPDESLPIIGRFFPRFELADIDSGHWVISEQPERFKEVVEEFLIDKD